MVDQYLRTIKKKLSITSKRLDLDTLLRDYDINPNDDPSLLHLLIQEEDLSMLELLLNLPQEYKAVKADPNHIDSKYQWTPLVMAINQTANGYEEAILALLKAKADPNMECEGKTPVQWAAQMNQVETIKLLQRYGADITLCNKYGTALHMACMHDNVECLEYLLSQHLPLDATNFEGDTALHICMLRGTIGAYQEIIVYYQDQIDKCDSEEGKAKIKDELKRIVNIQNKQGNTILHEAVINNRQALAERIRRLGLVDEYTLNNDKQTAKHLENDQKEEQFRETVLKQKQITEQRQKKQNLKQQRQQEYQQQLEEEQIAKEKQQQKQQPRDPEADASKIRWLGLMIFMFFLVIVYLVFDTMAKQGKRGERVVDM